MPWKMHEFRPPPELCKREASAGPNLKNLQIFHLLDRILRVCYIPRVFRCIRHGSGGWQKCLEIPGAFPDFDIKESKVCRPSISWYDLAERRFVIRRRVRLCREVLSVGEYARGCTHRRPKSLILLYEKLRVSALPTE